MLQSKYVEDDKVILIIDSRHP